MSLNRPIERGFQAVIAPEQFLIVGDERRRAENAKRLRFLGRGTQSALHVVALRQEMERAALAASVDAR